MNNRIKKKWEKIHLIYRLFYSYGGYYHLFGTSKNYLEKLMQIYFNNLRINKPSLKHQKSILRSIKKLFGKTFTEPDYNYIDWRVSK